MASNRWKEAGIDPWLAKKFVIPKELIVPKELATPEEAHSSGERRGTGSAAVVSPAQWAEAKEHMLMRRALSQKRLRSRHLN